MNLILPFLIASVISINMTGSLTHSNIQPPDQSQKPLFSFGIITDVHHCDYLPEGTRFYNKSLSKLRYALNTMKEDSVDFLLNLGDIIDRDFSSYEQVLKLIDSSGLKTYHCLGNHDYSVEPRYKRRIPLPMPDKNGYYSFIQEGFRFIVLNGNELSTYSSLSKAAIKKAEEYIEVLKSEGLINAIDWNGGISMKQLEWLNSQLGEATAGNENVFIFCHFPTYPDNIHNLLNYNDVNAIIGNYHNIITWFSGHNHMGNYGNFNMTHFVTLKGMVETENSNAWSVVEVYRNKIWIKGSGRERSQILAY